MLQPLKAAFQSNTGAKSSSLLCSDMLARHFKCLEPRQMVSLMPK